MRKDFRLGAIVGVFILFKNNQKENGSYKNTYRDGFCETSGIGNDITKVIIEEIFTSLSDFKN
jgi:hypothetical protein